MKTEILSSKLCVGHKADDLALKKGCFVDDDDDDDDSSVSFEGLSFKKLYFAKENSNTFPLKAETVTVTYISAFWN
jgi:hypothetical protein